MMLFNTPFIFSIITSAVLISGLPMNEEKRAGNTGLYPFPRTGRSVAPTWVQPRCEHTRCSRGYIGMISQPRVGRSQPEKTWLFSPEDYPDYHNELKRQGLIPFPRVGRAYYGNNGMRKYNGDATTGMWFGPRLGKFSKKSLETIDDDEPWTAFALKDISSQRDFVSRLGRETDETQSEDDQIEKSEQTEEQDVRQKRQSL